MAKFSMQRDPRVYQRGVAKKPPETKRAVGLDLGTNCGVAFADFVPGAPLVDVTVYIDQWDLAIGQYDSNALRLVRLKQFLSILAPDLVAMEDVKYDAPVEQFKGKPLGMLVARIVPTAEFLGSLKATVATWAEEREIPCQGLQIGNIKKFATGKGNANKLDMIKACNTRFGTSLPTENYENTGVDNMADAAFILQMLIENYSAGV